MVGRRAKTNKVQMPVDDTPNVEPVLTSESLDTAFIYSIDVDHRTRGYGFVVRVSHDPDTKERLDPNKDRRRFFVSEPGVGYSQFSMPIEEAMQKNIQKESRLTQEDTDKWNTWMNTNYVKPHQL